MPKPAKALGWAATAAVALFALNWVVFRLTGYPFAYCWGKPLLYPLWAEWQQIATMALGLGMIAMFILGRLKTAFLAMLGIVAVNAIPMWLDTLFRLGGACHAV
ncbi:MAG: hypothetical protein ACRC2U_19775 [Aeromonas sp.]